MTVAQARELPGSEWERDAADHDACEHTTAVMAMLGDGRLDDTIEVSAIAEAVAVGEQQPVPAADRTARARSLLASAYDRADGSMLASASARAVRSGSWDGQPLMRAMERALAGEGAAHG